MSGGAVRNKSMPYQQSQPIYPPCEHCGKWRSRCINVSQKRTLDELPEEPPELRGVTGVPAS